MSQLTTLTTHLFPPSQYASSENSMLTIAMNLWWEHARDIIRHEDDLHASGVQTAFQSGESIKKIIYKVHIVVKMQRRDDTHGDFFCCWFFFSSSLASLQFTSNSAEWLTKGPAAAALLVRPSLAEEAAAFMGQNMRDEGWHMMFSRMHI